MDRRQHPILGWVMAFAAPLLACVAGACAGGPGPATSGDATLAFTGARIWDGTGGPAIENGVLLVRDGRISAVGSASQVEVPSGAEVVALDGRWVIPGLVNAHGHVGPDGERTSVAEELEIYAHYGVTTVLSLGDEAEHMRDERGSLELRKARLLVAGPRVGAASAQEARTEVNRRAAMGVDWVKAGLTNLDATEATREVIASARARGLPVAVHIERLEPARRIVEAGAALVAHSVRDVPVDQPFIDLMLERGACLTPTLTREFSTFVYSERPAFFDDPFFLERSAPADVESFVTPERRAQAGNAQATYWREQLPLAMENLRRLHDAGVLIAMGTDSGPSGRFQGYFEHLEIEMMGDAGLEPEDVLRAATSDAARCIGLAGEVGTLEPGAWADLVALDASPVEDVRNTRRIHGVWIAGNRVR
jgi:imidazolonepropionase-like amidohydrolase